METLQDSLKLIADSIETGYSSVFTFAVREKLSRYERNELVGMLRVLASQPEILKVLQSNTTPTLDTHSFAQRNESGNLIPPQLPVQ